MSTLGSAAGEAGGRWENDPKVDTKAFQCILKIQGVALNMSQLGTYAQKGSSTNPQWGTAQTRAKAMLLLGHPTAGPSSG